MNRVTIIFVLLLLACTTSGTSGVQESAVAVDASDIAISLNSLDEISGFPSGEPRKEVPAYHHFTSRAIDTNVSTEVAAAQERLQSIYNVAGFQIGEFAQYLQGPTVTSLSSINLMDIITDPNILSNFTSNINKTVTTFMALIVVIGIFLVIGILMLIVATIFGFCRLCNRCGGKYPRKTGYSVRQITIVSVLIVVFSIIVWFFAAMVFVHSSEITRSVTTLRVGLTSTLADVRYMIKGATDVISGADGQIDTGTQMILSDLQAYNVSGAVAVLLTPAFNEIYDSLITLANTISSSEVAATQSNTLLNAIKTDLNNTRNQLTTIRSDVDALANVNVNGQAFTVALPDTSALEPGNIPDPATVPDISGYITKLSSAPNLTQVAVDSRTTYTSFTDDLPVKYNDTLQQIEAKIGSQNSSIDGMTLNLQTQLTNVDTMLAGIETTITDIFETQVPQAEGIRNDATKGIMIVLIVPFALAFIGVVVQKRKCVSFLAPICAIFVFLASIQFILYYVISIPLNAYCTSKAVILNTLYQLPEGNATIQPQTILSNCEDGQSLLTMQLSTDNSTLGDIVGVGAVLGGNYSAFIGNFSNTVSFPTTTLPDSTAQMSQLDSLDLGSLNFTAYTVEFAPINITTAQTTLQDFGASLTPQSFNASWTQAALDLSIADFNLLVQQTEPSFTGFTYASINQTYLTPNTAFHASDVTSVVAAQSQIQDDFDQNVYPKAFFKFGADKEILRLQGAIDAIRAKLDTFQTTALTPLTNDTTSLKTNIGTLETLIDSINGTAATITSSTNQFAGVVGLTVATIKSDVINLIDDGVNSVFGGLVGSFVNVGRCSVLAYDLEFIQDTVCTNATMSFNVLWFSFSVICIACLISFILGVKGQKRIGCRRLITPSDENALKKKKALEEF